MPQVRTIGVLVTPANRPPGDCCTGPGVSPDLVTRWLQIPLEDGKENLEAKKNLYARLLKGHNFMFPLFRLKKHGAR